jgi:hypothetical protein
MQNSSSPIKRDNGCRQLALRFNRLIDSQNLELKDIKVYGGGEGRQLVESHEGMQLSRGLD